MISFTICTVTLFLLCLFILVAILFIVERGKLITKVLELFRIVTDYLLLLLLLLLLLFLQIYVKKNKHLIHTQIEQKHTFCLLGALSNCSYYDNLYKLAVFQCAKRRVGIVKVLQLFKIVTAKCFYYCELKKILNLLTN